MADLRARLASANQLIDDQPRTVQTAPGAMGRLERLCRALARALPASGVGLNLLTSDNNGGVTVAASDATSSALEELEFTLGEGPCIDAHASGRPVLESDLSAHGARRWPAYAPAAQQYGVGAVFAFPLHVGAARAGALEIYRDVPGPLTADALSTAFTFAEVAMALLMDGHEGVQGNRVATDRDEEPAVPLEVYQAQGMVMVDLGVRIDEALARLRGHAAARNRSVSEVAREIVGGRLILDRDIT